MDEPIFSTIYLKHDRYRMPFNWLRVRVLDGDGILPRAGLRAGQFVTLDYPDETVVFVTVYGFVAGDYEGSNNPCVAWVWASIAKGQPVSSEPLSWASQSHISIGWPSKNFVEGREYEDTIPVTTSGGRRVFEVLATSPAAFRPDRASLFVVQFGDTPTKIDQSSDGVPRTAVEEWLAADLTRLFEKHGATMYPPEHWSFAPWWKRDDEAERKKWGW